MIFNSLFRQEKAVKRRKKAKQVFLEKHFDMADYFKIRTQI